MSIRSPTIPLFTYDLYSMQLLLLVVKKPDDVRFAPSCVKHCFVSEDMMHQLN